LPAAPEGGAPSQSLAAEPSPAATASRWGALVHPGYRVFFSARFLTSMAALMTGVAVGWQVYDLTHSTLALGLVGLMEFAPGLLLVLVTGTAADRFNRRAIMSICQASEAVCAATLTALSLAGIVSAWAILALVVGIGTGRAFYRPASQSLLPNLVPRSDLASAIAWSSSSMQVATILGPVAGGLLYGIGPEVAYGTAFLFLVSASLLLTRVPKPEQKSLREKPSLKTLAGGFRYLWHEKIVLGATSLDLFAVLLGGATALLPAYARDILETGPWGLGLLRAGPAMGALVVAVWLAMRPLKQNAGTVMFATVVLFGLATIGFGLSRIVWLSVIMLALMGATDVVSVFIRQTLVQIWTPDAVRGRVTAVNSIFIGASNELGAFRAGVVATFIGTVPAVVVGGIGTVAVAAIWYRLFPALRNADRLDARS
jgi:MFS family permease